MSKESTIRTKFLVGDTVWRIRNMKAERTTICRIAVNITKDGVDTTFYIANSLGEASISEDNIFATKQELLESL